MSEMDIDLDTIIMEDRDCRDIIAELKGTVCVVEDEEEYQRLLEEQKRKREEYLAFKAQRRRQSAAEHEFNASLARKEIDHRRRLTADNSYSSKVRTLDEQDDEEEKWEVKDRPKSKNKMNKKKMPLTEVTANVLVNRSVNVLTAKSIHRSDTKDVRNKRQKPNEGFGATTVLIQNLSAETNEYTIKKIAETIGNVIGVCVALEGNVRKAMVRFKSPVDALLFQKNFDNHQLGSTIIKTTFLS